MPVPKDFFARAFGQVAGIANQIGQSALEGAAGAVLDEFDEAVQEANRRVKRAKSRLKTRGKVSKEPEVIYVQKVR